VHRLDSHIKVTRRGLISSHHSLEVAACAAILQGMFTRNLTSAPSYESRRHDDAKLRVKDGELEPA